MVLVSPVAGSVASYGFGWEYLKASITVSTIAGNTGSACFPLLQENQVTYTSNSLRRPLVPLAVPGPLLRGMVPPSSEERLYSPSVRQMQQAGNIVRLGGSRGVAYAG